MRDRLVTLALLTAAALLAPPAPAQTVAEPVPASPAAAPAQSGRWITESGNLEVEIAPCGAAWCGVVTRVLADRSMSAVERPAEAASAPTALGLTILSKLQPEAQGVLRGEIYNRENGRSYRVRLAMDGPQQLLVHAYIGLPVLGKTQLWRRATAPQPAP